MVVRGRGGRGRSDLRLAGSARRRGGPAVHQRRRGAAHGVRPRARPWFAAAARHPGALESARYAGPAGELPGLACADPGRGRCARRRALWGAPRPAAIQFRSCLHRQPSTVVLRGGGRSAGGRRGVGPSVGWIPRRPCRQRAARRGRRRRDDGAVSRIAAETAGCCGRGGGGHGDRRAGRCHLRADLQRHPGDGDGDGAARGDRRPCSRRAAATHPGGSRGARAGRGGQQGQRCGGPRRRGARRRRRRRAARGGQPGPPGPGRRRCAARPRRRRRRLVLPAQSAPLRGSHRLWADRGHVPAGRRGAPLGLAGAARRGSVVVRLPRVLRPAHARHRSRRAGRRRRRGGHRRRSGRGGRACVHPAPVCRGCLQAVRVRSGRQRRCGRRVVPAGRALPARRRDPGWIRGRRWGVVHPLPAADGAGARDRRRRVLPGPAAGPARVADRGRRRGDGGLHAGARRAGAGVEAVRPRWARPARSAARRLGDRRVRLGVGRPVGPGGLRDRRRGAARRCPMEARRPGGRRPR